MNKKKKIGFILTALLLSLIFLANFTPLGLVFGKYLIHVYHYESSDRNFADDEVPEKGRKLEFVEKNFEEYKDMSGKSDAELYRTSKRNWFEFYEWKDFLNHPRWKYPYMVPSEKPNDGWRRNFSNEDAPS